MTVAHGTVALLLGCSVLVAGAEENAVVRVVPRLEGIPEDVPFEKRVEAMYREQPSGAVVPTGWMKEFVRRMEAGLTGHPEESGFPFDTEMWAGEMDVRNRDYPEYGDDWWTYESTAYYLDGALRCGYLAKSEKLLGRVKRNVAAVLRNVREDGSLVPRNLPPDTLVMWELMRILFEEYENIRDPALLAAIERHYLAFYRDEASYTRLPKGGFSDRTILNVEPLCRLAGETRKEKYARMAERLYEAYCTSHPKSPQNARVMRTDHRPHGHAVVYHEFLKLPAILHLYTGRPIYREALEKAIDAMHRHHVLADGLASGVEGLKGNASNQAHETCNVPEAIWVYGWALQATGDPCHADRAEKVLFNAGMGSIAKDFKSHLYYASPNHLTATIGSSPYQYDDGWGHVANARMCYRAGHDTECCTGAIHKILPYYVKRMWLRRGDEITAALYGPCRTVFDLQNGRRVTIEAATRYPFENRIEFTFRLDAPAAFAFQMRVPGWSKGDVVHLNNREIHKGRDAGCFVRVERTFRDGDTVEIAFDAAPVVQDRRRGVALEHGALVYSLPLKARRMTVVDTGDGKCSPAFPMFTYIPRSAWNYVLSGKLGPDDIRVVRREVEGYPWDVGNAPVALEVGTARTVKNWRLARHLVATDIPDQPEIVGESKTLRLVPLGTTVLRITVFAKGDY